VFQEKKHVKFLEKKSKYNLENKLDKYREKIRNTILRINIKFREKSEIQS